MRNFLRKIFSSFSDQEPENIKLGRALVEELAKVEGFSLEKVVRLLQQKPSLEEVDAVGDTPLCLAVKRHREAVPLLLAAGADINRQGMLSYTPLFRAVIEQDEHLVDVLLAKRADVNIPNHCGDVALNEAARRGNLSLVRTLLAAGAELDRPGQWGHTPLMSATEAGHYAVTDYLISQGADLGIRNQQGRTAYDIACMGSSGHCWLRPLFEKAQEKALFHAVEKRTAQEIAESEKIREYLDDGAPLQEPVRKKAPVRFKKK